MNVEEIRRLAVVGGGLMGSGLAQEFATAGYDVALQDVEEGQLKAAITRIRENLTMLAANDLVEATSIEAIVGRVTCTTALEEAVAGADLVIEAATETVEIKQRLFRSLSDLCPAPTILTSTTSAIHPDILAEATDCPERVIVAHFGFPNYLLPLVEMARAAGTSDETAQTIYRLLEMIGKRPIVMQKPLQGFIVNRLQMALIREALNIVSQGAARPEDIDTAVQNSFGRRYAVSGPLEVFDMTGLIVLMNVANQTVPHLATTDQPFDYIREKVADGNLGPTTGDGIYQWTPETVGALRRKLTEGLIAIEKWSRAQHGSSA